MILEFIISGYNQVIKSRDFNKIGRNEKCICGSGKKYKKCCGK
ncbi:SEC-C metal-binding domain-containing protein [Anaerosalibacter bizertensis]|nr:SEC-C metal-binding domain-containing protein [Anaerosalibacter bizertensis]MCB5559718.1 SEC-C domain-containing protein [Anaerosalibacter bizertensis]